jgi:lipopolysaccharide transport protein LptA
LRHYKFLFFCSTLLTLVLSSESYIDNLEIDASSIIVSPAENQIIFSDNVLLNTGKLILKSDSAIYNELNKTITLVGAPSSIDSTEGSRVFKGSANKIIFFSNSKVQLVGRAIMNYDNIDISSNSIVFNPENGKMTSNE